MGQSAEDQVFPYGCVADYIGQGERTLVVFVCSEVGEGNGVSRLLFGALDHHAEGAGCRCLAGHLDVYILIGGEFNARTLIGGSHCERTCNEDRRIGVGRGQRFKVPFYWRGSIVAGVGEFDLKEVFGRWCEIAQCHGVIEHGLAAGNHALAGIGSFGGCCGSFCRTANAVNYPAGAGLIAGPTQCGECVAHSGDDRQAEKKRRILICAGEGGEFAEGGTRYIAVGVERIRFVEIGRSQLQSGQNHRVFQRRFVEFYEESERI